ncbi:SdiA-regulated domain-containing protein [Citrobacter farmeri]|nr:SdiA-regulated domain-containing protein [Citrobacter farmeri]
MKARAPDGERTGSLSIPEITDPEAMEWMEDNLFRVGSEKEGSAWLVNIDILKGTYQLLSSIQLKDYTRPGNKGLEGLAWDKENQVLFAAKEKKPVMISRVDVQSEENSVSTLPTSATTSVRDVSGLHYHSPTASLLVLSDKSGKVLEINREGLVTDRLYLNAGWAGLTQNIPQAEGIALDDAGNLYIVSEPNLFYRFTKKQNGRT